MRRLRLPSITLWVVLIALPITNAFALIHPGIFNSQADLDVLQEAVNNDPNHPMRAGYDAMMTTLAISSDIPLGSLSYTPNPQAHQTSSDVSNIQSDAQAAYVHALAWVVTENQAHAEKSMEIMNGWAQTFVDYINDTVAGDNHTQSAQLIPIWAGAAEIIRHYNSGAAGWSSEDISQFEGFLAKLYNTAKTRSESCRGWKNNGCQYTDSPEFTYTKNFEFRGESLGQLASHERLSLALAMVTYGIFTDDEAVYDVGKEYYRWLLPRTIYPDGQNVELCRSHERVAMAMVPLQQIPEVAWHQGDDLYNVIVGNQTMPRLLIGMQWRAEQAYGLVTTGVCRDTTETFDYGVSHLPGWECAFNHYQNRMGIDVNDYVQAYVTVDHRPVAFAPDFLSFDSVTHADLGTNDSYGELLYSDDFSDTLAHWSIEKQYENTIVSIVDGRLDVSSYHGSTVWFNQKLSGNIRIEYDVTTLADGQDNMPRDHNLFWMAHNPDDPNVRPVGNGDLGSYDCYDMYYFGIGGNRNGTTRFRRYHNCARVMLQEYTDADHLNTADQTYHMTIICRGYSIQVYRNGQLYWDYIDPLPYTAGWFGFRQTRTHLQMDNFAVYNLDALVSLQWSYSTR
ncbi:DUF6250 domain-containing protein [Planctomycetota bacterium]